MLTGMPPPQPRPRARELGLTFGTLQTGEHNAITDVPGVLVGQVTVWRDEPDGSVARTGCTVVSPDAIEQLWRNPMAAGTAVLNGAGELTGSITANEWGTLGSPVVLVSTNNVGRGFDAVVDAGLEAGIVNVVDPVVGECDDSHLDDITKRWLTTAHVREAIDSAATGPVAEGVVGAGTGMTTMGHKGGIGTSSRVLDGLGTVGVLLLCNFGGSKLLRIGGTPIGEALTAEREVAPTLDAGGSCIGVVMTDIPLDARQLERIARRVGLGLARMGSVAHHGSGDIFLAASTTNRRRRGETGFIETRLLADKSLDAVFTAVVDASEEAVTNALFVADTVTGLDGHVVLGLPVQRVLELILR
jgi:D-aminopeptidase